MYLFTYLGEKTLWPTHIMVGRYENQMATDSGKLAVQYSTYAVRINSKQKRNMHQIHKNTMLQFFHYANLS